MSTSPLRLHTLPLDILIDIFKCLGTFSHLLPLLLTHRAFSHVWSSNYTDISTAISHTEFAPLSASLPLLHEQLHPTDAPKPPPTLHPLKLTPQELSQLHTNAQYLTRLLAKNDRLKSVWHGPLTSASPTELHRFKRAAYRAWLFLYTLELPRCEVLCDALSLVELIEMQSAARLFEDVTGWPGLPDFSVYPPPGSGVMSLESVVRRRILAYTGVLRDEEGGVDVGEVFEWKKRYYALNLMDPEVKGEQMLATVRSLEEVERKWREATATAKTGAVGVGV